MIRRVFRSIEEPLRSSPTFEQRWRGPDQGLITCWEVGRKMVEREPKIVAAARRGELPPAGWKGGVEEGLKMKKKIGTLSYLAQWQGMRGEDLDIDLDAEPELICSKTAVTVLFTGDFEKYRHA